MLARTRPLITERFKSPHFSHLQANKKLLLIGEACFSRWGEKTAHDTVAVDLPRGRFCP